MLTGIDVPPDSTAVTWEAIRTYGLMNISPHPSRSQKTRFRLLAVCMVIMTILYIVTLLKAMIDQQLWFFKTDKLGYYRPNIHTLLPLLSCITCMLVFSSIVLQERDYQNYLHVPTMLTQFFSYTFLHFGVVTRTWRILASLPTTSFELGDNHNHPDQRSSISPRKFNTLICMLYLSFPVVFVPIHVWMSLNTFKVGRLWFQVMPVLDNLILLNEGTMSQSQIQELSRTAEGMLETLHNPYIRAFLWWRIASSIYILFITAELAIFTYASIRLLKALGKRLQVISQAKAHATQLATIDIHMQANLVSCTEVSRQTLHPVHRKKSTTWLWMWLTSNDDIEPYVWNDVDNVVFSEVRYLEENYGIINRYRLVILCQLILCGILKVSFWILAVLLAFNVFGIVYASPGIDIVLMVHEWSNWTWGAPGILLALITTFSTFMPSLSGKLKRNTIRNTLDHQNSSLVTETLSWGVQLASIRQSILKGLQHVPRQMTSIGSLFKSRSDEREVGHEEPIVIDFSNLRYDESVRTVDLMRLKSYHFDEKIYPNSRNTTDLDIIKALRARDDQGVVHEIDPKDRNEGPF